jgi:hypothetical protein
MFKKKNHFICYINMGDTPKLNFLLHCAPCSPTFQVPLISSLLRPNILLSTSSGEIHWSTETSWSVTHRMRATGSWAYNPGPRLQTPLRGVPRTLGRTWDLTVWGRNKCAAFWSWIQQRTACPVGGTRRSVQLGHLLETWRPRTGASRLHLHCRSPLHLFESPAASNKTSAVS